MPRKPRFYLPDIPAHIVQRGNCRQATFFADQCVPGWSLRQAITAGPVTVSMRLGLRVGCLRHIHSIRSLARRRTNVDLLTGNSSGACWSGKQIHSIRATVQTGTPLGNERFEQEMEQTLQRKVGQARRGRPDRSERSRDGPESGKPLGEHERR